MQAETPEPGVLQFLTARGVLQVVRGVARGVLSRAWRLLPSCDQDGSGRVPQGRRELGSPCTSIRLQFHCGIVCPPILEKRGRDLGRGWTDAPGGVTALGDSWASSARARARSLQPSSTAAPGPPSYSPGHAAPAGLLLGRRSRFVPLTQRCPRALAAPGSPAGCPRPRSPARRLERRGSQEGPWRAGARGPRGSVVLLFSPQGRRLPVGGGAPAGCDCDSLPARPLASRDAVGDAQLHCDGSWRSLQLPPGHLLPDGGSL